MPTTIVVGGQFGSEGKGKVVALLASQVNEPWVVRCGGPNSGHTLTVSDQNIVLRQIPACANHKGATLLLAAGCVIDEGILLSELEAFAIPREKIVVDPRAILLEERDRDEERASLTQIGSTFSGTGVALVRRMRRTEDVRLAKDSRILQRRCRVEAVASLLHERLETAHGSYYSISTCRNRAKPRMMTLWILFCFFKARWEPASGGRDSQRVAARRSAPTFPLDRVLLSVV